MPPVIDTEEEDVRSNSSFSIGRPSEYDLEGTTADPLDVYDLTTDEPPVTSGVPEATTNGPAAVPVHDTQSPGNPQKRRSDPDTQISPHLIPPDEDMWRLFECKLGTGNAAQLREALASAAPEHLLHNSELEGIHRQCLESQKVIFSQIPWASASAERSRIAKLEQSQTSIDGDTALEPQLLTWEEELLLEMLAANEGLLAALGTYDDLRRVAVKREEERRNTTESTDTLRDDSSRQQPHAAAHILNTGQPVDEDSQPSSQIHVKALKDFIADPDDPDEISFSVGDILEILDEQGKWWMVQSADGSVGIAPSDHFGVLDGDDRQTESSRSSIGLIYPRSFPRLVKCSRINMLSEGSSDSFSQEEIFGIVDKQIQWWKAFRSSSADYSSGTGSDDKTLQYKAQALYPYDPTELSFSQGEILDIADTRSDWWPARKANGLVGIAPSNYLQLL
ncbi:hypothetical protein B0H12DRAFT_73240 [Mycena haematopus]|nr:hypothetical protein B0H12DRAFT_73240 [Mycena haematopus]